MKKIIYLLALISIAISACDKIEGPYLKPTYQGVDTLKYPNVIFPTLGSTIKKILIEDFTGHKCGNCPRSHEMLSNMKSIYGNKIIGAGIHVGYFAQPSTSPFTTDYRTIAGNDIDAEFKVSDLGLPEGMLNRHDFGTGKILTYDTWQTNIETIKNDAPLAAIQIINEFNVIDSAFCTRIKTTFLSNIDYPVNIVAQIVEDSIVDAQEDYNATPAVIPNYLHRNMLRGAINSTWGQAILSSETKANLFDNKAYVYSIKGKGYKAKNCYVLAYLMRSDTKEILQVEIAKVIQ